MHVVLTYVNLRYVNLRPVVESCNGDLWYGVSILWALYTFQNQEDTNSEFMVQLWVYG